VAKAKPKRVKAVVHHLEGGRGWYFVEDDYIYPALPPAGHRKPVWLTVTPRRERKK